LFLSIHYTGDDGIQISSSATQVMFSAYSAITDLHRIFPWVFDVNVI